jgi:hypothetical protein
MCSLLAILPGSCWTVQLCGTGYDGKHVPLGGSEFIMRRAGDRRLPYLIDNIRGTLVRKAAGNMRGTAALNHAAALRPGVDD